MPTQTSKGEPEAMARRRQIDDPRTRFEQRHQTVHEYEMAEVIRPELRLEPV